jgi:hypothetical protein
VRIEPAPATPMMNSAMSADGTSGFLMSSVTRASTTISAATVSPADHGANARAGNAVSKTALA